MEAVRWGHTSTVRLLLELGAAPDAKDDNGMSVTEIAHELNPTAKMLLRERLNPASLWSSKLFVRTTRAAARKQQSLHQQLRVAWKDQSLTSHCDTATWRPKSRRARPITGSTDIGRTPMTGELLLEA